MGVHAAWKKAETQAAQIFGANRRPGSGAFHNSHGTGNDDIEHDTLYVEAKYTGSVKERMINPVFKLYNSTAAKAEVAGKLPVIALRRKGEPQVLLLISSHNLDQVLREYAKSKGLLLFEGTGSAYRAAEALREQKEAIKQMEERFALGKRPAAGMPRIKPLGWKPPRAIRRK